MTDPDFDLSPETISRLCKGNPAALPTFLVHDDVAWPNGRAVQLDKGNRIHVRRSTFMRAVAPRIPVVAGLWLRHDVQEFRIDLKPHHLQGDGSARVDGYRHSREIVMTDEAGRRQDDDDYGERPVDAVAGRAPDRNAVRRKREAGAFRSSVFDQAGERDG